MVPLGWRSYEINGSNNESSFILWFDDQQRSSEGFYRNDVRDQTWVWWSREGILDSSGVFNRGIRSGKWTFRDPEANKQLEGRYRDGMLSDLITVAIDEAFNEEYEQFDIIDKEWTEWFSNGEKRVEVTYKSGGDSKVGKGSGTWNLWFENGNEKLSQSYVDGRADGTWKEWFENGTEKKNTTGQVVSWMVNM